MSDEIDILQGGAPGSEQWTQQENELHRSDGRGSCTQCGEADAHAVPSRPGSGQRDSGGRRPRRRVPHAVVDQRGHRRRRVVPGSWRRRFHSQVPPRRHRADDDDFVKAFSALAIGLATGGITDILISDVAAMAAEDGMQAVRCVRERASQWGIATDRVGVLGFSAGAVVTTATGVPPTIPLRVPDFVAPIYGAQPKMNVPAGPRRRCSWSSPATTACA